MSVAGIVPVSGLKLEFGFPWNPCLTPINKNFLAIEKSVIECAYAGCDNIWVVCNDDIEPLIRYRLGDYVEDPIRYNLRVALSSTRRKRIPIYYVPLKYRDVKRRNCLSWAVVHGAKVCEKVYRGISRRLNPKCYYVSFPLGIFDYHRIREHRKWMKKGRRLFMSHNNKTVKDNMFLSVALTEADISRIRNFILSKGTGEFYNVEGGALPRARLPIEERNSACNFTLADCFSVINLEEAAEVNLDWHYTINSWPNYLDYMSSGQAREFSRPPDFFLPNRQLNPMSFETEQE